MALSSILPNQLLHTQDLALWKTWSPGITIGGPKHLCWDEVGNLYVVGSKAPYPMPDARTDLYYQASTDGGVTFGVQRTLFTGKLSSQWGLPQQ